MRSYLYTFVLLMIAVIVATTTNAQTQKIDMPDGEAVTCVRQYSFPGGENFRFVATRSTLYASKSTLSVWDKAVELYQTNPLRRIVDVTVVPDGTDKTVNVFILQDDGIVLFNKYNKTTQLFEGSATIFPSPFQATNQQTYKKIVVNGNSLYVHFSNSMFHTTIQNTGWMLDSVGLNRYTISDIVRVSGTSKIVASTNKGLMEFDSVGNYWKRFSKFDSTVAVTSVFFAPRNNMFWVSTQTRGVYKSDNGDTWTVDTVAIGTATVSRWTEDATKDIVASAGTALYKKAPNAASWNRVDTALRSVVGTGYTINDINGAVGLYTEVATNFGCYSTMDGSFYNAGNTGIKAENITGLHFPDASTVVVSTGLGIFKKYAGTWSKVFPVNGCIASRPLYRADLANRLYTQLASSGTQQGAIYYSIDNGSNWIIDTVGLSEIPNTANLTPVVSIDRNGNKHIGVGGLTGTPMRLYSNYSSWMLDTAGFNIATNTRSNLCLSFYTDNTSTSEYVSGGIYSGGGNLQDIVLFKRQYGSSIWAADTAGLNRTPVSAFTNSKTSLYSGSGTVGGVSSLFKKSGNQWNKITSPTAATTDVRAMVIDSTGKLYVAYSPVTATNTTNRGVYATSDDGATWLYGGLDSINVRGLVANSDGVYAFTNRGSYKLSLQTVRSAKAVFSIHQIYFDTVKVGNSKDTTIRLSNTGDDTLRVTSFRTNPNFPSITVTPPVFNLAPGESRDVSIRYAPGQTNILSTTLRVVSNTLPDTIYLSGVSIKSSGQLQLLSRSLIFDNTDIGSRRDTVTKIVNIGTDTLHITRVVSTNPVFSALDSVFTLAANDTITLRLRFSPVTDGIQNGRIRIVSDGGNDSINVFGNGNVVSVEEDKIATSIGLSITPNPASQHSLVKFKLEQSQSIVLKVVNILGETIHTLENGLASSGEHVYSIQPALLQSHSGEVLFLRLEMEQSVGTIKFIVQ